MGENISGQRENDHKFDLQSPRDGGGLVSRVCDLSRNFVPRLRSTFEKRKKKKNTTQEREWG